MTEREPTSLSRRNMLRLGAAGGTASLLGAQALAPAGRSGGIIPTAQAAETVLGPPPGGTIGSAQGWDDYPRMLARIQAPAFPDRDFTITDFGAVADGRIEASDAIARAVAACAEAGGGRVVVPPGGFLTGPIVLRSNVNLHLAEGATLKFVTDPARYPTVFTRWEGVECMNYSPLVYAFGQENIGLTGKGVLDGQASRETWWAWKATYFNEPGPNLQAEDQRALIAMGERGVPVEQRVFGRGHRLRPNFFQAYRCRDVLVEDVTFVRSPMWEMHPALSANVTVRGVKVSSHGPNNDGCDPESCWDVLIENCEFDTGDDCIAIKSGKNNDGRRVNASSENVIVRGCRMKDGHGGVVLGSECSGHIRNVFVEDCEMDSPHLERVLRFKDNAARGGVLENVFARDIRVGRVAEAIAPSTCCTRRGRRAATSPSCATCRWTTSRRPRRRG